MCHVCFRKIEFSKLPPDQQALAIAKVVPAKYGEAEMEDLAQALRAKLEQKIDAGVLLWGAVGVGKTYAMAALAKKFIRLGHTVERVLYEMLCMQIRDTYNRNAKKTELEVIEPLLKCDMLFVEDVGVTRAIGAAETDFSRRTFQVVLDVRIEHERPTFLTTNKSLENLAASFDERVGDRLRTFIVVELRNQSKRRSPK